MGTNTLFRLVLVFGYYFIGFNKTCNDILETGINYKYINPRPLAGFFVYRHLGLVVLTFTLLEDSVIVYVVPVVPTDL